MPPGGACSVDKQELRVQLKSLQVVNFVPTSSIVRSPQTPSMSFFFSLCGERTMVGTFTPQRLARTGRSIITGSYLGECPQNQHCSAIVSTDFTAIVFERADRAESAELLSVVD